MNPYYDCEKCGLDLVGEIDYSSGSYEFDTRVVWKRKKDGRLLTARDAGCSCPTPFESHDPKKDLEDITNEYESYLRTEWKDAPKYEREYVSLADLDALIEQCRAALA